MKGKEHVFQYRYVCEKCGKQTDWIKTQFDEITEGQGGVELISNIVDKNRFSKQLQTFKDNVLNGKYGFQFVGGSSCPFCGARQSWLPATSQSIMKPAARIAAYIGLNVFFGLIFMIIIMICKANYLLEDFDDSLMLLIAFVVFPLIGLFFAIKRNIKNAKIDKQLTASTVVQNKPDIDWNGI